MAEEETSLRDDILDAMEEVKDTAPEVAEAPEATIDDKPPVDGRDEKGRFKAKETVTDAPPVVASNTGNIAVPAIEPPPQSLSPAMKEKWKDLPPEVRQEWAKREADVHKQFTSHDGALSMGKELKEVMTPYMAMIQAEGGTPASAVKDLLNTAYLLRTARPETKVQLIQQVCQQYGIDINQVVGQQSQDPHAQTLSQMQQELAQLRQATNPAELESKMFQKIQQRQVIQEIQAFASDPANVHYAQVEEMMTSIAPSMRERHPNASPKEVLKMAYDAACRADPTIFSTLQAQRQGDEQTKKTADYENKRKAAASITGSPGATVPNSGAPDRTLRDELRANLRAASS